jgi:branched-chain amino acid transport system substrate-binding protein
LTPRINKLPCAALWLVILSTVVFTQCRLSSTGGGDTYRIGAVLPLTGDAAQWGIPARRGASLAVEETNTSSDLSGKKFELVVEDSRCSPRDGVSAFTSLLATTKPSVVLGAVCSSVTLAIAPIAEREHVVLVSPASTNPEISQAGDFVFRVIPSDDLRGRVFADYLYEQKGFRRVAILYINNEGGVGNRNAFRERFESRGGMIVAEETYTQDATDVRSQLTRLKAGGAEALVVVSYPRDTVLVLRQVRELGLDLPLFFQTEAVEDANVLREAGSTAQGVTYILPAPPEGEAAERFRRGYRKRYGTDPELFAAEAYDVIMLFRDFVAEGGIHTPPTSDSFRDYLYKVRGYAGASGTITIDKNGDVRKPMAIKTIKDGSPVVVSVIP